MQKRSFTLTMLSVAVLTGGYWWLCRRNGEADFQRARESLKQVRSFRAQMISGDGQVSLLEYECPATSRARLPGKEEIQIGPEKFYRNANEDDWTRAGEPVEHPGLVCQRLASGQPTEPFPPLAEMARRGVLVQGSVIRVGGVRCREWHVQAVQPAGTRQETVCLGLDDFLPLQWKVGGATYTYSDWNKPMEIRPPQMVASTSEN